MHELTGSTTQAGVLNAQHSPLEGGSASSLLRILDSCDESLEAKLATLAVDITPILEQDQSFGSSLVSGGTIPTLVNALNDNSLSPGVRAACASTLSKLINTDCYTTEVSQPLRKGIVRALIAPDILPSLLSVVEQDVTESENAEVLKATFNLLSDVMYDNGLYDQDPLEATDGQGPNVEANGNIEPTGAPLSMRRIKTSIGTPSLFNSIFASLTHPILASSASDLLAQICYGQPAIHSEVVEALRTKYIPTAPAAFFAAFTLRDGGNVPIDAWTQLINGVVGAGGLDRMHVILKEEADKFESGTGVVEDRCIAVQGMRALLSGNDIDKDIGRKGSEELPKLIRALILDGTHESLKEAQEVVVVLSEYLQANNPFETWRDEIAREEVVHSLLQALAIEGPQDSTGEVYEDDPEAAAVAGELNAWEKYDETITATCWILRSFLGILGVFHQRIAMALLNSYSQSKRNASPIFGTLDSLVSALESSHASATPRLVDPRNDPLVAAIRTLLEAPPAL